MDKEEISKEAKREHKLKIESDLPIRTVGIETARERKNFTHLPPQNYLHVWWARRPTPATRLGVLASVLPEDVSDEELLRWMGFDPSNKNPEDSIAEHVRYKNKTVDDRDGAVYEHYGYRKLWTQSPNNDVLQEIHDRSSDTWGGELPTVLDATAGGGSIPFESVRYGFPTIANELNPVASVILQAVLKHPRTNGDLSDDILKWGEEINNIARENIGEYFPSHNGKQTLATLWAHTVVCPDCSLRIPLSPNWWIDKESGSEGVAARPHVQDDDNEIKFEIVELPNDVTKSEYNPTEGTISYGKAECPRCSVVLEQDEVRGQAQEERMDYQLYAIYYENKRTGDTGYMAPTNDEIKAFEKARNKIQSSPELSTLLNEEVPVMHKKYDTRRYGIQEWRDIYSPRQLLSHYTYWQAFEEIKPQVYESYSEEVAEAILTFLAIAADKAVDYNCRLSIWDSSVPKLGHLFGRHDFAFAWSFAENNLLAEGKGYEWVLGNVIQAYEDLHDLSGDSQAPIDVMQGDAAKLDISDESVEAVVLDPPYYDNVMYAELSDIFYVWLKRYLGDVLPDFFDSELTNKEDEAVAKPHKFDSVASNESSKAELAKDDYEQKMTEMFGEMHRVLTDDGIFTLMFTHKKTEAWDTLTKALIKAGFTVKATHPVSTENPHSLHQAGKNAAESTILLASEKRDKNPEKYTLWDDVKRETRKVATEKVKKLDTKEVEFTKVDMILASFGPTLRVFTENYPVVDDEGNEVEPQQALDEARVAVRDYLIENYLNDGVQGVDSRTEWYILAWLVFEAQRFPYDEGRRLAIGVGQELSELKRTHRLWRKRSGDILLRPHSERVQDINKDKENRSSRKPINPDEVSFSTALDKVHAAMHVYNTKGATEAWNWMNERNCGSDPSFKATVEALLRVLPHSHEDWEILRDIAAGETGTLLDLNLDADIFKDNEDNNIAYQENLNNF